MTPRATAFTAGVLLGAVLAAAGLWTVREYRRQHQSIDDAAAVEAGAAGFTSVNGLSSGLGPAFSGTSCASCHAMPAIGGWGTTTILRVSRRTADGTYHPYDDGPVVAAFSNPEHECQPVIPDDANVFSRRIPISTFGSGRIDAIGDELIVALEDPDDRNGDGIRGRAARVSDRASGGTRIGRFGWKAQTASLLAFTALAYQQDLGITSDLYPSERVIGVSREQLERCDTVADPEDRRQESTGVRAIDTLVAFMKSLPEPQPAPDTADSLAGRGLFDSAGCGTCHRAQVGDVRAFTDFLLHDIGTGDGISEGDAGPHEMRTAALWGIRDRRMYLHDGSASSIEQAIARHDGEAAATRERFAALPLAQQQQLVAFVRSR